MNQIYSKKENSFLYFALALLILATFIAGIYFVELYLWYILIPAGFLVTKGITISKNEEIPVIKLDHLGLTILKSNDDNIFHAYKDIIEIKMNSNYFNGFIKIRNQTKKIHLDSVAIPIEKQQEIEEIVNNKMLK